MNIHFVNKKNPIYVVTAMGAPVKIVRESLRQAQTERETNKAFQKVY